MKLLSALCAVSLLLVGGCNEEATEPPPSEDIIRAQVEKELLPQWVGARKLLNFKAEKSLRPDRRYLLTFDVEGLNKLGGPVRETFSAHAVSLGFGKWGIREVAGTGKDIAEQISR